MTSCVRHTQGPKMGVQEISGMNVIITAIADRVGT